MVIFDSHTHNTNSHDGVQTPEEQLNTALNNNFKGYAVTDHCEVEDLYWNEYCKEHIPLSVATARKMKELYKDKIIIAVGAEIGGALFNRERAARIISESNFDFILASCHSPEGQKDYCTYDYNLLRDDVPKILKGYFDMLEQTSAICDYDSLAHITYPIRYIVGNYRIPVDLNDYMPVIKKILSNIIARGKAMEVNSSGYRQKIGMSLPHGEIIRLYKDMGGKLITIGSDAHRSCDMGKDLDRVLKLIKDCGFDRYYYYQNRQPFEILI